MVGSRRAQVYGFGFVSPLLTHEFVVHAARVVSRPGAADATFRRLRGQVLAMNLCMQEHSGPGHRCAYVFPGVPLRRGVAGPVLLADKGGRGGGQAGGRVQIRRFRL